MREPKPVNIFIVGDLVVDHTVFLRDATARHQPIDNEPIYEVLRRMDRAGGAANMARILAVINAPGTTFLWGLVGKSRWGNFRTILEKCHSIDEANSTVEFRGVQEETQAAMNTITRLVVVEKKDGLLATPDHVARFDDYGHLHVASHKRKAVVYTLERALSKNRSIDGIVLNDLDMNCLTSKMIRDIAKFANEQTPPIPLFIDPKRDRSKYKDIVGTAILPNLSEWCSLVGQTNHNADREWRTRLDRPEALEEMAQLSFRYLGNFKYHIITCGHDGAVVIIPHTDKRYPYKYAVYRIKPHQTRKVDRPPQLGCGDVLTAVFALEYARSDQTPEAVLTAFQIANAVVACYRDMSWQRMPHLEAVERALSVPFKVPSPMAEPSKGMLFLPKEETVTLSPEYETTVPGLYSVDANFKVRVRDVLKDIRENWEPRLKSIIMGAPSGCGKSTIMSALMRSLGTIYNIEVVDYQTIVPVNWDELDAYFKTLVERNAARTGKLLVMVDEAMKGQTGEHLGKYGVIMLNAAHANNVRFLFIGTEFSAETPPILNSEITSRCRAHYLSGLAERPIDIPYIVASRVFENRPDLNSVEIEGTFLLAITNAILSTNVNPRKLCEWVDDACTEANITGGKPSHVRIMLRHLPKGAGAADVHPHLVANYFTFHQV